MYFHVQFPPGELDCNGFLRNCVTLVTELTTSNTCIMNIFVILITWATILGTEF